MADSYSKQEKEKKRAQKRKEKQARKEARKAEESKGGGLDAMMAYVDENGMIVDTPPDPTKKKEEIDASSIEIGIPKKEAIPEDAVLVGKVSFFNDDKGYGFIKEQDSQESYFVHLNGCLEPIVENNRVQFELEPGPKGMVAVKVKKI